MNRKVFSGLIISLTASFLISNTAFAQGEPAAEINILDVKDQASITLTKEKPTDLDATPYVFVYKENNICKVPPVVNQPLDPISDQGPKPEYSAELGRQKSQETKLADTGQDTGVIKTIVSVVILAAVVVVVIISRKKYTKVGVIVMAFSMGIGLLMSSGVFAEDVKYTDNPCFDYVGYIHPDAGTVIVKYKLEDGTEISDITIVKEHGTAVGVDYNTTTPDIRKDAIEFKGEIYNRIPNRTEEGSDPEVDKTSNRQRVITYIYNKIPTPPLFDENDESFEP